MHFFTRLPLSTGLCVLALGLAGAAEAQEDTLCGGIGAGAQWIAGDEASSDITAAAAPLDAAGLTVPPGGQTVVLFSVSEAGQYRVEALPQFNGDTVIDLYDAAGALLLTDDDSGGNFASRAEADLAPGSYCLATRSFGGGPLVADVRVGQADHATLTQGLGGGFGGFAGVDPCRPETPATPLAAGALNPAQGATATNTIASVPYYRFTLASPAPVTIRAENEWADPYIYIYDGQGNLIAENDDYNSLNARIDFTSPLAAGDYCIAMRALTDPNQPVTVSVRGYDPAQAMYEMYASGDASPPAGGPYPVTELGLLRTRLVMDQNVGTDAVWYSFTVTEGGLALIDAVEITDSDPVIRLFDGAGRMVAFNDDANGTLNSQLAVRVGPGNYMLGVTQYSQGYQGVIRVTIERYVPAQ